MQDKLEERCSIGYLDTVLSHARFCQQYSDLAQEASISAATFRRDWQLRLAIITRHIFYVYHFRKGGCSCLPCQNITYLTSNSIDEVFRVRLRSSLLLHVRLHNNPRPLVNCRRGSKRRRRGHCRISDIQYRDNAS
jgi:hypothetical protein